MQIVVSMGNVKLLAFTILTGISALILYRIYVLIVFLRPPRNYVWNHYPGPCQLVKGVDIGSEDLELLPNGLVLISTGLQPWQNAVPSRTGKSTILMVDLNKTEPEATAVEIQWAEDKPGAGFYLHGLSSWKLDDQTVIVFAVCHERSETSVLRFKMNMKTRTLQHLETIREDNFFIVNDLVAAGERSFYFTNCMYYHHVVMQSLEFILQLSLGSVGYYNGSRAILLVTAMNGPNGILISDDQRRVFVSESGGNRILEFSRDTEDTLNAVKEVYTYTYPDNLFFERSTGQLLVACHTIPGMLLTYMFSPDTSIKPPSQVLGLQIERGHITDNITEFLASEGNDIAGASTAVIYNNRLLVGTVMHKALLCDMVYPPTP